MENPWQPIETIPEDKVLIAEYAPTNWSYYVKTVDLRHAHPRLRELHLKYARAWMPIPPEPKINGERK